MNEHPTQHPPLDPEMQARHQQAEHLVEWGKTALLTGNQAQADRLLAEAVALYETIGDSYCAAAQTGNYGWALHHSGQIERAQPYLHRAAELFAALGMHDLAAHHRQAASAVDEPFLTEGLLAALPPAIRGALERNDLEGLQYALTALPIAEQQIVFERLVAAGIIRDAADDNTADEALHQFDLLLRDIAAVAMGDSTNRAEIEVALTDLEHKGWQLRAAVHAMWAGQRDLTALTDGLDQIDARLVQRVLELLKMV